LYADFTLSVGHMEYFNCWLWWFGIAYCHCMELWEDDIEILGELFL